jgi:hypothetical protein
VNTQTTSSNWMNNHVSQHCLLGKLSKSIPPLFIFIAFFSLARLSEVFASEFDLFSIFSNIAIIGVGLYFLSRRMSWEQQAAFVLISIKIAFGLVGFILTFLAISDFIKSEWGAFPYFLVGVAFLPIWEFMFGLYKHHGKLTIVRLVLLLFAGISIYIQLES